MKQDEKPTHRIKQRAIELLESHEGGLRYTDLQDLIHKSDPDLDFGTISTQIPYLKDDPQIYHQPRGLYYLSKNAPLTDEIKISENIFEEARNTKFTFSPGCTIKPSSTSATQSAQTIDHNLRHNDIQYALYQYLSNQYGKDSVGTEIPLRTGVIDAVLMINDHYHIYEIKTALSARACIREALAQLLEYSYWPGNQEAKKLVIVGEPCLDDDTAQFLNVMRNRFSLPLSYLQYDSPNNTFIETKVSF